MRELLRDNSTLISQLLLSGILGFMMGILGFFITQRLHGPVSAAITSAMSEAID